MEIVSEISEYDHLFNMREDPHQLTNVIDVPANRGIRETLTRKLVRSMMSIAAPPKVYREFTY